MTVTPTVRIIDVMFATPEELELVYNQNICKGGYFVPCENPSPRTTRVEVRFHLPGLSEPLAVPGEVAFAAGPEAPMPGMGVGMAIQFFSLTPQLSRNFHLAITIAKSEGMTLREGPTPEAVSPEEVAPEPVSPEEVAPEAACPEAPAAAPGGEELPEGEEAPEGEEPDEATAEQIMAKLNMLSSETLYFQVRRLPHYHKIAAAKRGNRNVRNILLQEGNKQVMTFMLQNPLITPGEVISMLKMSNLPLELITMISKNSQFNQIEDIKYFIVVNPKTPLPLALNLLNTLTVNNVSRIAKAGFRAQLKAAAIRILDERRKGGGG